VFYTRVRGELLRISLGRIESANDGPQVGFEHNRGTMQTFCLGGLGLVGRASAGRSSVGRSIKQIAAMKLDGEVGIFESMAGQDQDDGLAGFDESAAAQLLESSQRNGGGRFATDAIGADFGFGNCNFEFRDLFDLTASCL
jgi:hypothetical protein